MAWSGGNFTRANPTWATDAGLGIGIEAGRHDAQDNDFTTGIDQCLNKTGQNSMTGDLNLGGYRAVNAAAGTAAAPAICAGNDVNTGIFGPAADTFAVATNGTERVRVDSTGVVMVGTTTTTPAGSNVAGAAVFSSSGNAGLVEISRMGGTPLRVNRGTDDGNLVEWNQAGVNEGAISVSGNTITYGAFSGSHWAQLQDGSRPDILRGTVIETINELCEWGGEENERLAKVKISDTVKSKAVYGVFMTWDSDWDNTNDMLVTSLGAFICRMHKGAMPQVGDLLESNGDGTARVQADDVVRSSTIGKVTCSIATHRYKDGTFCVPVTLMCG